MSAKVLIAYHEWKVDFKLDNNPYRKSMLDRGI